MSYDLTDARYFPVEEALNWARNGIAPSGSDARKLARFLNGLGATRKKCVFSKTLPAASSTYDQAEITLWRFACHTGPFTATMRAEFVLAPTRNPAQTGDSSVWWESNTGLAGSGTTTTHDAVNYWSGDYTGTVTPDLLVHVGVDMAVTADQDYTWALKVKNGVRVVSATVYEVPLSSLYTGPTGAIDCAGLTWGLPVTSADVAALLDLADKLWKRGAHHFGGWTEYAGITRSTASYANLWDQTLTAWSATSPGLIAPTHYQGSLDSAAVGAVVAVYAKVASGSGKVIAEFDGGSSDAMNISSTTGAWYSDAFDLDSLTAEEKLDIHVYGAGAGGNLTIYAASAWAHVA